MNLALPVRARLASGRRVPVDEARKYLRAFVEFVDVPVFFNGQKLSGASHRDVLPSERYAWREVRPNISLGGIVSANLEIMGMASGELRIVLEQVKSTEGLGRVGSLVLLQGRSAIRTLRFRVRTCNCCHAVGIPMGRHSRSPFSETHSRSRSVRRSFKPIHAKTHSCPRPYSFSNCCSAP